MGRSNLGRREWTRGCALSMRSMKPARTVKGRRWIVDGHAKGGPQDRPSRGSLTVTGTMPGMVNSSIDGFDVGNLGVYNDR